VKQVVLELMVSQDGGVPLVSKSWDGHTSDIEVFQARAQALIATLKRSPSPRYLVADCKLSHEDHAPHLQSLGFITRIPQTLKLVAQVIRQALATDPWHHLDEQTSSQRLAFCHFGMAQRWLVVRSQEAAWRAERTLNKAQQKEHEAIAHQLFHLQAQRFATPQVAHEALAALGKQWKYHQVESSQLVEYKRYATKGRPTAKTPIKATEWQMQARVSVDVERLPQAKQYHACFVLGSTIEAEQLSDADGIAGDKEQAHAEGGFRFLKDPLFFVSSLFVKKPSRIQGLLMVMTLALLVYAVAQRRLRQELARQNETIPNQINHPTNRPTLRWVFQMLEGIERVRIQVAEQVQELLTGLTAGRIKILRLFGAQVCHMYQVPSGEHGSLVTAAKTIPENAQPPCSMSGIGGEMRVFYPVFQVTELAAGYRDTTGQTTIIGGYQSRFCIPCPRNR
jgi:transposase